MARKLIKGPINDETLNNTNHNFEELYEAPERIEGLADQAVKISRLAIDQVEENQEKTNNIQAQLDTIVVNGDSSPAADQARVGTDGKKIITYNSLKERLDKEFNQFVNSKKKIKIGEIKLPSSFPNLPFKIFKKSEGEFSHNATPYNINNWQTATEVFISSISNLTDSRELGLSPDRPINLNSFSARYSQGNYGSQKNIILSFLDNIYTQPGADFKAFAVDANLLFRSRSDTGMTKWGNFRHNLIPGSMTTNWTRVGSSLVYKAVVSGNSDAYPTSIRNEDKYGIPSLYKQVDSYTKCANEEGTYYLDNEITTDVYIHLKQEENINDIILYCRLRILNLDMTSTQKIVFDNMFFAADTINLSGNSTNVEYYFFNCKFFRGLQDAVAFNGIYKAYMLDCMAAHPSKDAYNYHATSEDALAVEINCGSIGAGKHKFIGGNSTTGSNNGSTAHNGMYMLRVGCWASESEGPTFADIQDCYSINIGCGAYDILDSTTGNRAAFFFACETRDQENEKPKYVIECRSSGKYYERGIWEQYCYPKYQGFIGDVINQSTISTIEWEDLA